MKPTVTSLDCTGRLTHARAVPSLPRAPPPGSASDTDTRKHSLRCVVCVFFSGRTRRIEHDPVPSSWWVCHTPRVCVNSHSLKKICPHDWHDDRKKRAGGVSFVARRPFARERRADAHVDRPKWPVRRNPGHTASVSCDSNAFWGPPAATRADRPHCPPPHTTTTNSALAGLSSRVGQVNVPHAPRRPPKTVSPK